MKRNIINEIIQKKERSEYGSQYDYAHRLGTIEAAFPNRNKCPEELLKYIPIATVACFEANLRYLIKEVVDFGKPYSDNVSEFNQSKNVKFDFDIISAIQSKSLTIGEFVAHILPCNNLEDINSNLSTLLKLDFLNALRQIQRESIYEHVINTNREFRENFDSIISDVKKIFELRHIFCHEFAMEVKVDKTEIFRCFDSAKEFLYQTNTFIQFLLYPNTPETQADMNVLACTEFEKSDAELNELIRAIKDTSKVNTDMLLDVDCFDDTIEKWKEYRDARANLTSSVFEGGSMQAAIRAKTLRTTTIEKIESLNNEFGMYLKFIDVLKNV